MRVLLACLLVVSTAAPARADAKIDKLIKFYAKEARVCAKNAAGIGGAKGRAVPYLDEPDIKADHDQLAQAHGVIATQCADLEAMLEFLRTDPKATYKQLQSEIDKRDKNVRAGRKASKQALTDSEPVIKRLIPKINARAGKK